MGQSINLIPQQEQQEQVKVKLVKSSTVVSILLLFLVAGVAVYYFYKVKTLDDSLKAVDDQISQYRTNIQELASTEVVARNLDTKSSTLRMLFDTRPAYSTLLKEFKKRVPTSVLIDNLTINVSGSISISGTADSYISIAEFVNGLTNANFPDAGAGLGGLFTNVSLNSVSLESKSNRASYFINVSYDSSKLTTGGVAVKADAASL